MMQRGEQSYRERARKRQRQTERRWSMGGFKEPIGRTKSSDDDFEVSEGWVWNSGLERWEERAEKRREN